MFLCLTVMTGWEKQNQYRICNANDQQFLHAKEREYVLGNLMAPWTTGPVASGGM